METNSNIVKDIQKIIEDNRVQIKPKKDVAGGIMFSDLSAIVEIVKREKEKFVRPLYINIETEKSVSVITSLDAEKDREEPYSAVAEGSKFSFGCGYDYEKFVIAIRSLFVQTEDTAGLLELLKKVSNVDSVEMEDDGVTQKVVAQQGAMLAVNVKVAPIRKLAPFRTFMEVEQPESEFLFRIDKNNNFSLYEADGGAWRNKAKKNIRLFFEQALKEEIATGDIVLLG